MSATRYINAFRAKSATDDRWMYGDLIRGTHISHPMGATTIKPETVGMCANFIDKKGKSVFEGDIVEFINEDGDASHYVIKFDGFRFESICIGVHHTSDYIDSWWDRNVTVIGNIHDNPELISGKQVTI